MLRMVKSPVCSRSFGSNSCHDNKTTSCCPWRMPRPRVPTAFRNFQQSLRASISVTSQSTSNGKHRSLLSLFGKRHSTPVVAFNGPKDFGVTGVQELMVSKSVGAVTDQFATLAIGSKKGRARSTTSRRSLPYEGSDQGSIKCSFSLPGAVIDEDVESKLCAPVYATRKMTFYSEIDTNITGFAPSSSDEAKPTEGSSTYIEENPVLVYNEEAFTEQAGPAHEVDILVITHSDDSVGQETTELTAVEEFIPSSSSKDNNIDSTTDRNDCPLISSPVCTKLEDMTRMPEIEAVPAVFWTSSSLQDENKICNTSRDNIPYDDEDNLEDEVQFYEKTSEEGDDYLDIDELLDRCPKSEVIRNLQSAMELSKCATRQMERALKKWSRISRGPFPREPGTRKTKAEIVDERTIGLRSETARYLDEMNKVFFNFYCVTEQLDDIEERQERLVESIKEEMRHSTLPASPQPVNLPKRKQDLADLYTDNRSEGRFECHKVSALLRDRIPSTVWEEE